MVSIVIPCHNAEHWIAETLQSCIDQTYRPIEIIVVDDASADASANVVRDIAERSRRPAPRADARQVRPVPEEGGGRDGRLVNYGPR